MALGREMGRLRRLPVFAGLDEDALRLVAFSAEARSLPVGHVLFRRDETAESALLVASGAVVLEAGGAAPRRCGPGSLIDESALLAGGMRSATATVVEPASVIAISRAVMLRVLEAYPTNAVALRRYWAERLAQRLEPVGQLLKRGSDP